MGPPNRTAAEIAVGGGGLSDGSASEDESPIRQHRGPIEYSPVSSSPIADATLDRGGKLGRELIETRRGQGYRFGGAL